MERPSQGSFHSLSLDVLVGLLVFNTILIWVTRLHKLSLEILSTLGLDAYFLDSLSRDQRVKNASTEVRESFQLNRDDVARIMGCMGMDYSLEGEQLKEVMGFDELSTMFEEKEPNLDELMAAFYVFDENCDGFIDSMELHRVLSKLGFGSGVALETCDWMIAAYDGNGDGRIDFNEFAKFMESSFC